MRKGILFALLMLACVFALAPFGWGYSHPVPDDTGQICVAESPPVIDPTDHFYAYIEIITTAQIPAIGGAPERLWSASTAITYRGHMSHVGSATSVFAKCRDV